MGRRAHLRGRDPHRRLLPDAARLAIVAVASDATGSVPRRQPLHPEESDARQFRPDPLGPDLPALSVERTEALGAGRPWLPAGGRTGGLRLLALLVLRQIGADDVDPRLP